MLLDRMTRVQSQSFTTKGHLLYSPPILSSILPTLSSLQSSSILPSILPTNHVLLFHHPYYSPLSFLLPCLSFPTHSSIFTSTQALAERKERVRERERGGVRVCVKSCMLGCVRECVSLFVLVCVCARAFVGVCVCVFSHAPVKPLFFFCFYGPVKGQEDQPGLFF